MSEIDTPIPTRAPAYRGGPPTNDSGGGLVRSTMGNDTHTMLRRIMAGHAPTDADYSRLNGASAAVREFATMTDDDRRTRGYEHLARMGATAGDIESILGAATANKLDTFSARYISPLFNIGDALQPQPPIDWVVYGLAESGGVAGVFGKPGSKKTYILLDLGICVALGVDWLGHKTKQCRVLWIDEDSGKKRLLRRLGDVARGHEATAETPFEVLSLAGVNVLLDDDRASFERLIRDRGAGLVVIDTLADITGGAKIVSPDEMQPVLQSLRRIAEATNALIVFIHHTNKAGDFLGAINISGKADLLLQVESSPDSTLIKFGTEKARDSGAVNFAAQANFYTDTQQFWLSIADIDGLDRAARIATMGGAARHVYDHLNEHDSATIDEMCDELHKRSAVEKSVKRLIDSKIISRSDAGGRGQTGTYALMKQPD